jgi:hypothetical protein
MALLFAHPSPLLGVTLVQEGDSVGVASLPSVMMDRERSEVKRGRPAVALDMVQVCVSRLCLFILCLSPSRI